MPKGLRGLALLVLEMGTFQVSEHSSQSLNLTVLVSVKATDAYSRVSANHSLELVLQVH